MRACNAKTSCATSPASPTHFSGPIVTNALFSGAVRASAIYADAIVTTNELPSGWAT